MPHQSSHQQEGSLHTITGEIHHHAAFDLVKEDQIIMVSLPTVERTASGGLSYKFTIEVSDPAPAPTPAKRKRKALSKST